MRTHVHAGGYSANFSQTLSSTEVYDPNTRTWAPGVDMPTPRGDLMCDAMGDVFVVLGGFYDPTNTFISNSQRSEVQAFNPNTGEVSKIQFLSVLSQDACHVPMK